MPADAGLILGFDPGGQQNFGWCVCATDGNNVQLVQTGRANDALEAIEHTSKIIDDFANGRPDDQRVLAAAIDAPLYWGMRGNRAIDGIVRAALRNADGPNLGKPPSAQEVNSLRGGALVQGLLVAHYVHENHPNALITEAHPKALHHLLKSQNAAADLGRLLRQVTDDHERDATTAAYAAWSMLQQRAGWRDLALDAPHPIQPFGTPVSYWMPIA